MLHHPGSKPQRPICPVTLVTLAETLPQLDDPTAATDSQGKGPVLRGMESQAIAAATVKP